MVEYFFGDSNTINFLKLGGVVSNLSNLGEIQSGTLPSRCASLRDFNVYLQGILANEAMTTSAASHHKVILPDFELFAYQGA